MSPRWEVTLPTRWALLTAGVFLTPLWAQEAVYERDSWPGEGIPVLVAKQDALKVHRRPDNRSPMRSIPYRAGWRIPFEGTLLRTLRPAELTVRNPEAREIWCAGTGVENVAFEAGETVVYLQYRAEGAVTARVRGKICEVFLEDGMFGGNLPEPDVQWWVQVVYADGASPGWLLVDERQVEFARREF